MPRPLNAIYRYCFYNCRGAFPYTNYSTGKFYITSKMMKKVRRIFDMRNILIVNFLGILINLFFVVMQLQEGFWPIEAYFQPVLTTKDKSLMLSTLQVFIGALEAHNITYMLYMGSLIGSYRHHGMIPWDDDIDIIVNSSQLHAVKKAVAPLATEFELHESSFLIGSKFFSKSGEKFAHQSFSWPYIDIFWFGENSTHIWDENPQYYIPHKKTDLFPLQKRPFEGMQVFAPCDSATILARTYKLGIDKCGSRSFSHIKELPLFSFNQKDVPCSRLASKFPFVERTISNGVMTETLKIADWTLQSVILPSKCIYDAKSQLKYVTTCSTSGAIKSNRQTVELSQPTLGDDRSVPSSNMDLHKTSKPQTDFGSASVKNVN
ncbi:unnamed protein product [Owenia fusiformis]|uniref:LicD/FKTN/FKRP nucleotidyltransferase domain-containing protein n=1 Tax=Owenia fusiformis TaxID=6347 RepID=A0A8S4PU12_OWEFU|nr:unnamed protein product [Owenia fusiformis]